jgi:hypothetical protein
LDPCVYDVCDPESALELNPEVAILTPGTLCIVKAATLNVGNSFNYGLHIAVLREDTSIEKYDPDNFLTVTNCKYFAIFALQVIYSAFHLFVTTYCARKAYYKHSSGRQVDLPPCTRHNAHKYMICCHNIIIMKHSYF